MSPADIARVTASLKRACSAVGGENLADVNAFAQIVCDTAHRALNESDPKTCDQLVKLAESAFATINGTSVINAVLFEVFEPLQQCVSAYPNATKAFQSFIAQVAANCNPQETLTLFMSTLAEAAE
jgi:hypothetical protein